MLPRDRPPVFRLEQERLHVHIGRNDDTRALSVEDAIEHQRRGPDRQIGDVARRIERAAHLGIEIRGRRRGRRVGGIGREIALPRAHASGPGGSP